MTFPECVSYCAGVPELVSEFNRLTGRKLGQSLKRTPLDRIIDEASGYPGESEEDMASFATFVFECIWQRLPDDAFKQAIEDIEEGQTE